MVQSVLRLVHTARWMEDSPNVLHVERDSHPLVPTTCFSFEDVSSPDCLMIYYSARLALSTNAHVALRELWLRSTLKRGNAASHP